MLVHTGAADGPELAVNEADEVGDGKAFRGERVSKLAEVWRPRGEGAFVDQVPECVMDVLHLRQCSGTCE